MHSLVDVVASAGDRERRLPDVVADPSTVNNDVVFSSVLLGRPLKRQKRIIYNKSQKRKKNSTR